MKPYFQTKLGCIYHGDCREILPTVDRPEIILADPQYGINHPTDYLSRGRSALAKCTDYPPVYGDNKPFDPAHLLKAANAVCLWGANYFARSLPEVSGWLIWDKLRPDDLDQATVEMAWTNFVKGARRYSCLWNGMIRTEKESLQHPTQKPVSLMVWVLSLRWTPEGSVCDPYLGSGTTAIACEKLGRSWTGIEISEEYCEIAAKRIERETRQLKLFAE